MNTASFTCQTLEKAKAVALDFIRKFEILPLSISARRKGELANVTVKWSSTHAPE